MPCRSTAPRCVILSALLLAAFAQLALPGRAEALPLSRSGLSAGCSEGLVPSWQCLVAVGHEVARTWLSLLLGPGYQSGGAGALGAASTPRGGQVPVRTMRPAASGLHGAAKSATDATAPPTLSTTSTWDAPVAPIPPNPYPPTEGGSYADPDGV